MGKVYRGRFNTTWFAFIQLFGEIANMHPNITFSIQHLSKQVANPFVSHYIAATRVLRYLKNFTA